jgi:transcription antitermination factor NusG
MSVRRRLLFHRNLKITAMVIAFALLVVFVDVVSSNTAALRDLVEFASRFSELVVVGFDKVLSLNEGISNAFGRHILNEVSCIPASLISGHAIGYAVQPIREEESAFATEAKPSFSWYALNVRYQHEARVNEHLRRKGLRTFLPYFSRRSKRLDRKKILQLPIFPCYLFVCCQMSKGNYIDIVSTNGVIKLLGNGFNNLSTIPYEEISSISKLVEHQEQLLLHTLDYIHEGDNVKIATGPLAGVVGTLVEKKAKKSRLSVSIRLINGSLLVEVDSDIIEKA